MFYSLERESQDKEYPECLFISPQRLGTLRQHEQQQLSIIVYIILLLLLTIDIIPPLYFILWLLFIK